MSSHGVTPEMVKYHLNSPLARVIRWLSGRPAVDQQGRPVNWCVTLGRHTFISLHYILSRSRAHEFYHTIQQDREGWRFWWRYLRENLRKGYTLNHYEVSARMFAESQHTQFATLGTP